MFRSHGGSRLIDAVASVMNYCAAGLLAASVLLIVAASVREGADLGGRMIAAISRGDMIALASQH